MGRLSGNEIEYSCICDERVTIFESRFFSSSCPECRITSNYVVPSLYWVDTKEEKEKLLNEYKQALNKQNCKYFKEVSYEDFIKF